LYNLSNANITLKPSITRLSIPKNRNPRDQGVIFFVAFHKAIQTRNKHNVMIR
jgi:hypothetical protein